MLGLTFKRDTDDERDSLSPKLIRLLERELADVAVCDPHAPSPTQPLGEAVQDADVVIVATNHSEFERPETFGEIVARASPDCLLVDPWNASAPGRCSRTSPSPRRCAPSRRPARLSASPPVNRVLVTGGAGMIGSAVVRRLLRDPAWEIRVSDHRPAPTGCARGARSRPATCATATSRGRRPTAART